MPSLAIGHSPANAHGCQQPQQNGMQFVAAPSEAPDQPGAGQPVHPGPCPGGPDLAFEHGGVEPLDAIVGARLWLALGELIVKSAPQRQKV